LKRNNITDIYTSMRLCGRPPKRMWSETVANSDMDGGASDAARYPRKEDAVSVRWVVEDLGETGAGPIDGSARRRNRELAAFDAVAEQEKKLFFVTFNDNRTRALRTSALEECIGRYRVRPTVEEVGQMPGIFHGHYIQPICDGFQIWLEYLRTGLFAPNGERPALVEWIVNMPQNSSGIGLEVQHRWFHEVSDLKSGKAHETKRATWERKEPENNRAPFQMIGGSGLEGKFCP
jgi:hypothetical protein